VTASNFADAAIKEGKQAEFLIERSLPWSLVTNIGVNSRAVRNQCEQKLTTAAHKPRVDLRPDWYY
jgi:hypothetical protein